ncbi:DUF6443 domain-containing protein [Spirosoma sp. SC4-14]|uniref:DUF6443 domain-containing protein n=1 Tax=Spirosoma sp. SC4-14 TaxID=3128900 RepID=UPI0030D07334
MKHCLLLFWSIFSLFVSFSNPSLADNPSKPFGKPLPVSDNPKPLPHRTVKLLQHVNAWSTEQSVQTHSSVEEPGSGTAITTARPPKPLPIQKPNGPDPIRFTLQANKTQVAVGEEVELTITAELLPIAASQLFFFDEQKSFRLKLLLPEGAQQTGGTYYDLIGETLSPDRNRQITYTWRGTITSANSSSCFRLLRGTVPTVDQSLFVEKGRLCIQQVDVANKDSASIAQETGIDLSKARMASCSAPTVVWAGDQTTTSVSWVVENLTTNDPISTLLAKGCPAGATIKWYKRDGANAALLSSGASTTYVTHNAVSTQTVEYRYYATCICADGESSPSSDFVITVNRNQIILTSGSSTACGSTKQYTPLTVQGCPNGHTIKFYTSGPYSWTVASTGNPYVYDAYGGVQEDTYQASCIVRGIEGPRSNSAVIAGNCPTDPCAGVSLPKPTISGTLNFTTASPTSTLTASGCGAGQSARWYRADNNNYFSPDGLTFTFSGIPNGFQVYAKCISGTCVGASSDIVTFTVSTPPTDPCAGAPLPAAPTSTNGATICSNNTATLTASGCSTNGYRWYTTNTGGNSLNSTFSYTTPTLTSPVTYFVSCSNTCGESGRTAVTANIHSPTNAISITTNTSNLCQGQTALLTVNNCNGTVFWSDNVNLHDNPRSTGVVGTYTANCQGVCGNATQSAISILNGNPSIPSIHQEGGSATSLTVCAGSNSVSLWGDNCEGTVVWFANGVQAGQGLPFRPTPSADVVYTAKCVNACTTSAASNTVTVHVINTVAPSIHQEGGSATSLTVCAGSNSVSLWGDNCEGTVVWFANGVQAGQGLPFRPTPSADVVYTAKCVNACTTSAASNTVTVHVINTVAPSIHQEGGSATSLTVCAGSNSVSLWGDNCEGTVVWFANGVQAGQGLPFRPTPSADVVYTAKCVNACTTSAASNTVTVHVINTVAPSIHQEGGSATSLTVCAGSNSVSLWGDNCEGTVVWFANGVQAGQGLPFRPTPSADVVYTAKCVNACTTSAASNTVTVHVINTVAPSIHQEGGSATSLTVCAGSNSVSLWGDNCEGTVVWFANGVQAGQGLPFRPTPSADVVYTAKCVNACTTSAASNTVTVHIANPTPTTKQDGSANTTSLTVAYGTTIGLRADGCPTGLNWYKEGQASSIASSVSFTTIVTQNVRYLAKCISTLAACPEGAASNWIEVYVNGITTASLSATSVCQSGTFTVPFSSTGTFGAGNTFTVQLSDANGGFNSPTVLGTGGSSPLSVSLPASIAPGNGYRVRVVSSNPALVGNSSPTVLTVSAPPSSLSASSNSPAGQVSVGSSLSLTLSGQGLTGATYRWKGPNSFTSTNQNPTLPNATTAMSGSYTVVVTTPGGCTAVASTSAVIGTTSFTCTCQDCDLPAVQNTDNPPIAASNRGSSTQNYVQESVYLDAAGSSVVQSITYFDGLGRPSQKVNVGVGGKTTATPVSDVVTPIVYDAFGRETTKYLPYAEATNNGTFRSSAAGSVSGYYSGLPDKTGNAYASIVYEASPLNRVLKQTAPGSNTPVQLAYRTNTAGELKLLTYDFSTKKITVSTYGAGQLYVTETTDENGNKSTEYKDKEGRVVGKDVSGRKTLYAYDDFGWLRCVVPPKASGSISGTIDPFAGDLLFAYDYDTRGRMVTKKVPGAGSTTLTYDTRDRLITTTDAKGTVITTDYDDLNRVTATRQGSTTLTQTYYDSYGSEAKSFDATHAYGVAKVDNQKGLATSTKTLVLGTSTYLTTSTYYDDLGRVIQTVADNHKGGLDRSSSKLDYTGRVLEGKLTSSNSQTTVTVETRTSYDAGSRVKAVCQRVSDNLQSAIGSTGAYWEPVARHTYNGIGELTRKTLGCGIQNLDYTYQMRGWLTKINDPANLNAGSLPADKDFFGMKLTYDPVGNISAWDYRTAQRKGDMTTPYDIDQSQPYTYSFAYDNLNRLKSGTLNQQGQSGTLFAMGGGDNGQIGYDDNGNIKTLTRSFKGTVVDNLTYTYKNNDASNQLASVADAGTNPGTANAFFKDGTASYTYDANGNLLTDSGKGITTGIAYNYLNLPQTVTYTGGAVTYTYSATGQKLRADFGNGKTYDYIAGFVYAGNQLEFIPSAEGRVLPPGRASTTITAGSSATAANSYYRYEYQLKDHLGNLRVACRCGEKASESSPSDAQTPLVVQENHYDPFGLDLTGLNKVPDLTANRFKYNGKEDEAPLGWIDFNWRHYDPALARFVTVDKLAEKFPYLTTYQFASNDPIGKIELDGLEGIHYFVAQRKQYVGLDNAMKLLEQSGISNELSKEFAADNNKTDIYINVAMNTFQPETSGDSKLYSNYNGSNADKGITLQDIRADNPQMSLKKVLLETIAKNKQAIIIRLNGEKVESAGKNKKLALEIAETISHEIKAHAIDDKDGVDNTSQAKEHQIYYNDKSLGETSPAYQEIKHNSPAGMYKSRIEKAARELKIYENNE